MTMRCEQCRHWKPEQDWAWETITVGDCKRIPSREELRNEPFEGEGARARSDYDDWDDVEAIERDAAEKAKAWTYDASSYISGLTTKPDFGCVLFEAKSDAP